MTDTLTATEAPEEESAQAPARPSTMRRLLAKRRSDRKGALGSTEMVQLIGVILLIALLAGGTFVYLRFIRGSSENSVVQRNIDEVSKMADAFWQNYSADTDGRRKIGLDRFCQFANNQLAEDDLNLRTLQASDQLAAGAITAYGQADGSGDGVAEALAYKTAMGDTEASCGSDPTAIYQDIFAWPDRPTGVIAQSGYTVTAAAATFDADAHNAALEAAGLLSTATVWMAQYGDGVAATLPNGDLTTDFAPDGADTVFAATDTGVEVLVFGGMAPSGDSFCLIKVFDAADADKIGEYRVSLAADGLGGFATCLTGVNATGDEAPRRGGQWPEPQ